MPELRLEHLNLPARDPAGLARWYAATFGLVADAHRVHGPGVLLVFQQGDPLEGRGGLHFGFNVQTMAALAGWAERFDASPVRGEQYTALRVQDPEGNTVEIYCPNG